MNETCYKRLTRLFPDLPNKPEYIKLKSSGMMDLNMDLISSEDGHSIIALSHYYKHPSGDLIPDPDMVLQVNFDDKTVNPISYQDSFVFQDIYRTESKNQKLENQLLSFLNQWLTNLLSQCYTKS